MHKCTVIYVHGQKEGNGPQRCFYFIYFLQRPQTRLECTVLITTCRSSGEIGQIYGVCTVCMACGGQRGHGTNMDMCMDAQGTGITR